MVYGNFQWKVAACKKKQQNCFLRNKILLLERLIIDCSVETSEPPLSLTVFIQVKRIIITKTTRLWCVEAFHHSKLHHTIQPQHPEKEEHSSTFKEADAFLLYNQTHPLAVVQTRCGPCMLTKDSLKSAYNKKDEKKTSPVGTPSSAHAQRDGTGKRKRERHKSSSHDTFPRFLPRVASGKCVETSFLCSGHRAWTFVATRRLWKAASVSAGHETCPARSANTYRCVLWDSNPLKRWQFIMKCCRSDQIIYIIQAVSSNRFYILSGRARSGLRRESLTC